MVFCDNVLDNVEFSNNIARRGGGLFLGVNSTMATKSNIIFELNITLPSEEGQYL